MLNKNITLQILCFALIGLIQLILMYIIRVSVKENFEEKSTTLHKMNLPLGKKSPLNSMFKIPTLMDNKCSPLCCMNNNTYSCSTGCVCLTEKNKQELSRMR